MPLWGNKDQANNAPKFRVTGEGYNVGDKAGRTESTIANTFNNVASNSQIVTVAGVDVAEAKAQAGKLTHPGWVVVRQGTGPVTSITSSGGSGYTNGNIVTVSNGTVNATATVSTNSTGGSLTLTLTNSGRGFINTSAIAVAVANSTGGSTGVGTGATFTVALGGRAGRRHVETLVAMGSMTGDAADDALFPDT
jgi:hypothetical protein